MCRFESGTVEAGEEAGLEERLEGKGNGDLTWKGAPYGGKNWQSIGRGSCKKSYSRHTLIPTFFEFVEIKVLPRICFVDCKVVLHIKLHVNGPFFSRRLLVMTRIR